MPDESYNIIKAVEGLQNVANVNPLGRRQQRKRKETPTDQQQHELPDEQPEEDRQSQQHQSDIDPHTIDYRA